MVEVQVRERHEVDRVRARSRPLAARAGWARPRTPRWALWWSSMRSPMPVSTRTRPDGRLHQQAVERLGQRCGPGRARPRRGAPTSSAAPARGWCRRRCVNVPAWMRAMVVPAPRSARQSALASMGMATGYPCADGPTCAVRPWRCGGWPRSRGRHPRRSAWTGPGSASPGPCEPYGRSTGLDISKNEIWPMRMPKYSAMGRLATLDSSSVRLPFQPGST